MPVHLALTHSSVTKGPLRLSIRNQGYQNDETSGSLHLIIHQREREKEHSGCCAKSNGDMRGCQREYPVSPEAEWVAENIAYLSGTLIIAVMLCRLENILISIALKLTVGKLNKIWETACHALPFGHSLFSHFVFDVGSSFPNQGWNPCPLQWKQGILTAGPKGSAQSHFDSESSFVLVLTGLWFPSALLCCAQMRLTLCNAMDYSPPDSSVHGSLQARILERVAISSSRRSSPRGDRTHVSRVSCLGGHLGSPSETAKAGSIESVVQQLSQNCGFISTIKMTQTEGPLSEPDPCHISGVTALLSTVTQDQSLFFSEQLLVLVTRINDITAVRWSLPFTKAYSSKDLCLPSEQQIF